jgi:hypothetical protein
VAWTSPENGSLAPLNSNRFFEEIQAFRDILNGVEEPERTRNADLNIRIGIDSGCEIRTRSRCVTLPEIFEKLFGLCDDEGLLVRLGHHRLREELIVERYETITGVEG